MNFYNLLNEEMHKKGEATEYGNAPGVNQALANPNTLNRPFAWPVKIRSSMSAYYQVQWSIVTYPLPMIQVEITDLVITGIDKFHWDSRNIACFVKVRKGCKDLKYSLNIVSVSLTGGLAAAGMWLLERTWDLRLLMRWVSLFIATLGLHLGFSAKLRILQVLSCKMEPLSGMIMYLQPPTHAPRYNLTL